MLEKMLHKWNVGNEQWWVPTAIAVSERDGNVYVSDCYSHYIMCFTGKGDLIRKWGDKGDGNGEFNNPCGIAIRDSAAEITAAIRHIAPLDTFPPGIVPLFVAYCACEDIYVVDNRNNRVQVFETDGTFIRKWGSHGNKEGEFFEPRGCSVSISDEPLIYVCDAGNARVQVFDPLGRFVRHLQRTRSLEERLDPRLGDGMLRPMSVALHSDGRVFVTDSPKECVHCFFPDGTFSYQYRCGFPDSICTRGDRVYVANGRFSCVSVFDLEGSPLGDAYQSVRHKKPEGIVVTARSGLLYVIDGRDILCLQLDDEEKSTRSRKLRRI